MFAKYVGLTAETLTLVEAFRQSPEQPFDSIINQGFTTLRTLSGEQVTPVKELGCDLGQGAVLDQDEQVYCYLHLPERGARTRPDGTATARDGVLFIDGEPVVPQRGAWLQAALREIQSKVGHVSRKNGGLVSLNAWDHWYAVRNGELVTAGKLRSKLQHRKRRSAIDLHELGLA